MDCIEWIDTQISDLLNEVNSLKMQRKVLIDAQKYGVDDELEGSLVPKGPFKHGKIVRPTMAELEKLAANKPARKPRTSGVKEAVLETISHWPTGIKTAGIIAANSELESGSIRQALNGLKKKGEIMQDGKMWMKAPSYAPDGSTVFTEGYPI